MNEGTSIIIAGLEYDNSLITIENAKMIECISLIFL